MAEQPPKSDSAEELKKALAEVEDLKTKLKMAELRVKKKEKRDEEKPPTEQKDEKEPVPHSFEREKWQHHCTGCGAVNPDWKDEVKCKECGTHLGSAENALKIPNCPHCGATGKVLERV